jgi:hypothetical protein
MKVDTKKATIILTEQTVRELLQAIEKAKQNKVDHIKVSSEWSSFDFEINIETEPHTQESLGFRKIDIVQNTVTPDKQWPMAEAGPRRYIPMEG